MKISWNCLNDIIELKNINIKQITDRLTLAGLEVENITYNELIPDTFIKIDITANRQDLNSFISIATEISALLNLPIQLPEINSNNIRQVTTLNHKYSLANINIKNSARTISLYLKYLDLQITETFLDTIKIINLKWGQKIQVYHIRSARNESSKYNNNQVNFQTNILSWQSKILHEINSHNIYNLKDTIDIVIINKPNIYSEHAYKELFNLLNAPNVQKIDNIHQIHKQPHTRLQTIICRIQTIKNILGPKLNGLRAFNYQISHIINLLTNLNFQVQKTLKSLIIKIPEERIADINHEIDIIEEIGRIYGFKNFKDTLPLFKKNLKNINTEISTEIIRRILRSFGLHEIINYSLIQQFNSKKITLINPLNQELANLRTNLLENIIKSKKYNLDQNNEVFEVFEIGTIFNKILLNSDITETKHLCCLIGNDAFNRVNWDKQSSALTWHQAKGQIEEFLEKLQANIQWSTKVDKNKFITNHNLKQYIHKNRYIYLTNKERTIGVLSQLNNKVAYTLNIHKNLFFLEIDIFELLQTIKIKKHLNFTYNHYPQYPKITRDLSLKFKKKTSMKLIEEKINKIKQENQLMIESVKVINEYFPHNRTKTLCLRIIYRSIEKTLTHQEIEILDNIFKDKLNLAIESKA
jgi:phenylalanyl-tRNA synthetase beta subunit